MPQSAADTTMLRRYGVQPQQRRTPVAGSAGSHGLSYGAQAPVQATYRPGTSGKYMSGSEPQGAPSAVGATRGTRRTDFNTPVGSEIDWYNWGAAMDGTSPFTIPPNNFNPGGGGRGGGGGGGGGGAPGMDQGTLDAMLAAMRGGKPQDLNMPAYQGTPLSPFSTTPWDTMRSSVDQAAGMDRAASTQGYDQLASRLGANFINPYTNAPVQGSPQLQNAMINLMQGSGVGPGAGQDVVSGENAYSRNSDDAFRHLLGVLGAGAQQSQDSRLAQVGMDANTAQRGIDASAFGMRSAADMQQANALRDYTQRADDRTYADNQLAQQWQREQAQGNWAQQNQSRQQMLSPLLELIGSTNGAGLDLSGLMAMLQGGQ